MSILTILMIAYDKKHSVDHGPIITDSDSGEVFCGGCGLVLKERVEDMGNESRTSDLQQYLNNSRTGAWSTLTIHDRGLSTIIDKSNRDAMGNPIHGDMKNTMGRLRIWDSHSKSRSADRSLRTAFQLLDTIKRKMELSDAIAERAAYFYRKAVAMKLTRGRNINGLVLSALYAACREANVPRTLQDIADAGNVNTKFLSRHYRILAQRLELNFETFEPKNFVSKIVSALDMSQKTGRDAIELLRRAKEKRITAGKNPVALAAASLYLASVANAEQKSQKKISTSAGVSCVTIRNLSTFLRKKLAVVA